MTEVDVVVVTFDTREVTLDCVSRIDRGRPVVVDNGSRDGTATAVRERFPAAEVERLEQGVGFAAACNAGAARGSSPLVLFLNSDVLARPGAIDRLVTALVGSPGAVAAGGRLVDPGTDDTQPAYAPQRLPGLGRLLARVTGLEALVPDRVSPELLAERGTVPCEQPAGACLLVRRDAFAAVGGFDERYWFWYEDVDLARRLRARGTLLHVGAAAFEHLGGGTFAGWGRARGVRSRLHGIGVYGATHLSRPAQATLGAALVVSGAVRAATFAVLGRGELARAWREGVVVGWKVLRGWA